MNPNLLYGLNPEQLLLLIGKNLPRDVAPQPANSESAGRGPGWKIEYKLKGGIQIRWSPGSARSDHPQQPYWRVSSGLRGKSAKIAAGAWEDRPPEFGGTPELPSLGGEDEPSPDEPLEQGPCACGGSTGGGGLLFDDGDDGSAARAGDSG